MTDIIKPDTPLLTESSSQKGLQFKKEEPQDPFREISKAPSLELVRLAIEAAAVNRRETEFEVDISKFDDVLSKAESGFERIKRKTSEESVSVPDDYDLHQKVQRALRDAIDIVFKMKLVNRETLVTASQLAGPGNIFVVEDMEKATTNLHGTTVIWNDETQEIEFTPPIPLSPRSVRNGLNYIALGLPTISAEAGVFLLNAKDANLPLSKQQALDLAILEIAAHEEGHLLDAALSIQEQPTLAKSQSILKSSILTEVPGLLWTRIHKELVARGIEDTILNEYMKTKMGFSQEQVDKFLKVREGFKKTSAAVTQFVDFIKGKGYSIEDIMSIENAIRGELVKRWGSDKTEAEFQSFFQLIEYGFPAYTAEETKFLLHYEN